MKLKLVGKSTGLCLTLVVFAMMLGARVSNATSITYNVDQTIGPATVMGTITTNGDLGAITSTDITAFNLTLSDTSGDTFNYTGSVGSSGADITATSAALLFNYSGTDNGYLLFQPIFFTGTKYFCLGTAGNFPCFQGESIVPVDVFDSTSGFNMTITGDDVFATAAGSGTGSVPEPSTVSLMLVGVLLSGLMMITRGRIARALPQAA